MSSYQVKGSWSLSWKVAMWLTLIQMVIGLTLFVLLVASVQSSEAAAGQQQARTLKQRVYTLEQNYKNLRAQVIRAQRTATAAMKQAEVAYAEAGCVDGYVPTSIYRHNVEFFDVPYQLDAFGYDTGPAPHYKLATLADDCASTAFGLQGVKRP
jgi:hypothetical protein